MKDYLDNLYSKFLKLEQQAWEKVDISENYSCCRLGNSPKCITCPFNILVRKKLYNLDNDTYFPPTYINIEDTNYYYSLIKEFCINKECFAYNDLSQYIASKTNDLGTCHVYAHKALIYMGYKRKVIKFSVCKKLTGLTIYYLNESSLITYKKEAAKKIIEQGNKFYQHLFNVIKSYCKNKNCFFYEELYHYLVKYNSYEQKQVITNGQQIKQVLNTLGYKNYKINKQTQNKRVRKVVYYLEFHYLEDFLKTA